MSNNRNGASSNLRADLIAANIFQRAAAHEIANCFESCLTLAGLSVCAYDAAAAFIAESQRRNPQTGELTHPVDGLPKDE